MTDLRNNQQAMREVLERARVIAVVGMTDNPERPSYEVGKYLEAQGYTIYPVNPAVQTIDGAKVYASLSEVPEPIDIVDVFRRAEFIPEVVEDAIRVGAKAVWVQLGIVNEAARQRALDAGLDFVMDACIKIEHGALGLRR